jgi:hypothetical protein
MRSNARDKWIFSAAPVHAGIISAEELGQAQQTLASRGQPPERYAQPLLSDVHIQEYG